MLGYSYGNTLKGVIAGINLDFIAHKYPLAGKSITTEGIRMLSIADIAAMKLNAIAGDGTRIKDFIDIYFIFKQYNLGQVLDFYAAKYTKRNQLNALKSLSWFDDIDETVWPRMIPGHELNLTNIKTVIEQHVKTFSSNLSGHPGL